MNLFHLVSSLYSWYLRKMDHGACASTVRLSMLSLFDIVILFLDLMIC
jgi:hypothetical protein